MISHHLLGMGGKLVMAYRSHQIRGVCAHQRNRLIIGNVLLTPCILTHLLLLSGELILNDDLVSRENFLGSRACYVCLIVNTTWTHYIANILLKNRVLRRLYLEDAGTSGKPQILGLASRMLAHVN